MMLLGKLIQLISVVHCFGTTYTTLLGDVTVEDNEDVIDSLLAFAMNKENEGQAVSRKMLLEAQDYLCGQMHCVKEIGLPSEMNVPEMGSILMEPWEDPAKVVEKFRQEVLATGKQVQAETITVLLNHFCFFAFEHSQFASLSDQDLLPEVCRNLMHENHVEYNGTTAS
jgi:hypothetical protein